MISPNSDTATHSRIWFAKCSHSSFTLHRWAPVLTFENEVAMPVTHSSFLISFNNSTLWLQLQLNVSPPPRLLSCKAAGSLGFQVWIIIEPCESFFPGLSVAGPIGILWGERGGSNSFVVRKNKFWQPQCGHCNTGSFIQTRLDIVVCHRATRRVISPLTPAGSFERSLIWMWQTETTTIFQVCHPLPRFLGKALSEVVVWNKFQEFRNHSIWCVRFLHLAFSFHHPSIHLL